MRWCQRVGAAAPDAGGRAELAPLRIRWLLAQPRPLGRKRCATSPTVGDGSTACMACEELSCADVEPPGQCSDPAAGQLAAGRLAVCGYKVSAALAASTTVLWGESLFDHCSVQATGTLWISCMMFKGLFFKKREWILCG